MRISAGQAAVIWAQREFGHVRSNDARRTARLVAVAACACERPGGRVSAVFRTVKEREGAYDVLENDRVSAAMLVDSTAEATASRIEGMAFVYVPIDGTSLTLPDHARAKDFGAVGSNAKGARGLKVIDALAVSPDGVTVGWLALTYWARSNEPGARPAKGSYARAARDVEDKETWRWIETIRSAKAKLDAHGVRGWFQIDREGDGRDLLLELASSEHWWTVRSNTDRTISLEEGDVGHLREQLATRSPQGSYDLEVSGTKKRRARTAHMVIRVGRVTLRLRDPRTDRITPLAVTAVWTREHGTTPADEEPIDWLLLTSREVQTLEQAREVIAGYAARWRVEGGRCCGSQSSVATRASLRAAHPARSRFGAGSTACNRACTCSSPSATRTNRAQRRLRSAKNHDGPEASLRMMGLGARAPFGGRAHARLRLRPVAALRRAT